MNSAPPRTSRFDTMQSQPAISRSFTLTVAGALRPCPSPHNLHRFDRWRDADQRSQLALFQKANEVSATEKNASLNLYAGPNELNQNKPEECQTRRPRHGKGDIVDGDNPIAEIPTTEHFKAMDQG